MSCNCLKIYLQRVPDNIPAHHKEVNGTVMLDLYEDQTFLKSKKNEQLTEFDKISGAAVIGIRVPPTEKNNLIFCGYAAAGSFSFNHKAKIAVVIFENGLVLDQDVLIVIQEDRKGWELDFAKSDSFWKEALIDTRLSEIIWGCFTLTEANVNTQWVGTLSYADGDAGYFWTVAHWKNWNQLAATYDADNNLLVQGETGIEDTRPFLYVLAVLQKGFCLKGWKFRSPILESTWGRQLLTYVLKDFGGEGDLSGFGFRAEVENDYAYTIGSVSPSNTIELHTTDETTNPNYDACDFHRNSVAGITPPPSLNLVFYYATGFSGEITVDYCITMVSDVATVLGVVVIVFQGASTLTQAQTHQLPINTLGETFCGSFVFTGVAPTDTIIIFPTVVTLSVQVVKAGTYWSVNQSRLVLQDNSVVPIEQLVKSEYKFLDFFKGVLHILGRGKIITDFVNKEVWLFHEQDVQLFDLTQPEAFYKPINDPLQITDKVICKSRNTKLNTKNLDRFYRLCFKDSTDAYVELLNFNNDTNPLWGRLLDFGEDFNNNNIKKSCNPFFEPTAQILADDVVFVTAPYELPALWDDDEDRTKIAYDIAPRILYLHTHLGNQLDTDDGVGGITYRELFYQAGVTTDIPNLFQFTTQPIGVGAAAITPDENVVYGTSLIQSFTNEAKDMYTLFWRQLLIELYRSFSVFYDVLIDNCFYNQVDFRKYVQFTYEGQFLTFKLLQIRGFKPCLAKPSKFELRPIIIPDTCIEDTCIQCYLLDEDDIEWYDADLLSSVKGITTDQGFHAVACPPCLQTINGPGIKAFIEGAIGGTATVSITLDPDEVHADVNILVCEPNEVLISITICLTEADCASPVFERTYFFVPLTVCD